MHIERYIGLRQRDEIAVAEEVGIEHIYLEWNGKWGNEPNFGKFRMIWRWRGKGWDNFMELYELWKSNIDYVIVPRTRYKLMPDAFVYVEDEKDLEFVFKKKVKRIAMKREYFVRVSRRIYKNVGDDVEFILFGNSARSEKVVALVTYYPLDNAIAKRLLVYRNGVREIRSYDEFGRVDMKITIPFETDIDFDRIKEGDWYEILRFNMLAYKLYEIEGFRHIPKWLVEYEKLKREGRLPEWADEVDKNGRPKAVYLRSRYNRIKHGLYAKALKEETYLCDTCPIKDICPLYEEGGVCAFTHLWKDIGNTRNVEWVIAKMEELLAEELARYFRALYIEGLSGDVASQSITKLGDSVMKHLELYAKLLGLTNEKVDMNVDMKVEVSLDKAIDNVRKMYGDELAKMILEKIGEDDGENEREE